MQLSLIPGLSLSVPIKFARPKYYVQKIEGEGEPGTELRQPVAFMAMVGQEFD